MKGGSSACEDVYMWGTCSHNSSCCRDCVPDLLNPGSSLYEDQDWDNGVEHEQQNFPHDVPLGVCAYGESAALHPDCSYHVVFCKIKAKSR